MEQVLAWHVWPDSPLLDQSVTSDCEGWVGGQGDTLVSLPGIAILQGEAAAFSRCSTIVDDGWR